MPGLFPEEEDEEEKWGALLGMPQLSAPALSDPSMRPQPMPTAAPAQPDPAEHWEALANGLPTPPTLEAHRDNGGLILAMFADAILNKGRSLGTLMAAAAKPKPNADIENYQLQRQHALDQAGIAARMQRPEQDPRTLALRERGLELQSRGLDLEQGRLDAASARGTQLTPEQQLARERFEFEKSNYGQPTAYQEETLDLRRQQAEAMQEQRAAAADTRKQNADTEQARKFTKDSGKYLDLGQALREVDGDFAKHPKDLPGVGELDRFQMNNDLPLVGAGEEGLKVRKDLAQVRDILARERSGAAFAGKEKEELYRLAAGLDSSNEAEVRASVAGIKKLVQGSLRARRVGREDIADRVLGEAGIGDWLGPAQQQRGRSAVGPGLGVVPGQAPPMVRDVINPNDDEWEDL
jgi:hypothetical protein